MDVRRLGDSRQTVRPRAGGVAAGLLSRLLSRRSPKKSVPSLPGGVSSKHVDVEDLAARVDILIADGHFSGVIRVNRAGATVLERAAGWAHRAYQVPMTVDTRLAIASGSKWFTALVALSLAADGTMPLATPARELLGADLPLVDDRVTVEHPLAHRSGIGDYLDESAGYQVDHATSSTWRCRCISWPTATTI